MKFFIIHGAFGNPQENWFPWLTTKLQEMGHTIIIPTFPTPKNQTLENWMNVFEPHLKQLDSETIIIGHSLGPAFILSVLEKLDVQIKACFLVAGFTGILGDLEFDSINKSFIDKQFNWEKITQNCQQFFVLNSENDPYVPINKGQKLALNLKTEINTFFKAGHFNTASGYTKFPELLELIKLSINQNKISIKNQNNEKLIGLESTQQTNNKPQKTIILVHGFGMTKNERGLFDKITISLINNNFLVYRFDFSGCGESEGNYNKTTLTKLKNDLNEIINYIKQQEKVDKKNIGIIGQSFGTAIILALEPKVKTIALMGVSPNPISTFKKLF
ncbi:MAG: alpha/beta fold hydrolase, partial [Candidatus Diapherotrites archaeon]|nr:alpha/beta fold hydrolase [Candidatus Diapherotrites archaeon]